MRGQRSASARSQRKGRRSRFRGQSGGAPHTSLDSFLRSIPADGNRFGDCPRNRPHAATRLVFQNLNGVPALATSSKQIQINRWLQDEHVGIALLAETNRRWSLVLEGHRWNDRMRDVARDGHFSAMAYNQHLSGRQQQRGSSFCYGGCVASALHNVAHASKEQGSDPTGLGRWAYIRIRGKKIRTANRSHRHAAEPSFSHDLVVVAAYRPNPPGAGESTVWAQHRIYFNSTGRGGVDPRKAFVEDLSKEIE